jgi:hypothetical protein
MSNCEKNRLCRKVLIAGLIVFCVGSVITIFTDEMYWEIFAVILTSGGLIAAHNSI